MSMATKSGTVVTYHELLSKERPFLPAFFSVTSTNVGISPKTLTYIFHPLATLV